MLYIGIIAIVLSIVGMASLINLLATAIGFLCLLLLLSVLVLVNFAVFNNSHPNEM